MTRRSSWGRSSCTVPSTSAKFVAAVRRPIVCRTSKDCPQPKNRVNIAYPKGLKKNVLLRKAKFGCTSGLVRVDANLPIRSSNTTCVLVGARQGRVRAHGILLDDTL